MPGDNLTDYCNDYEQHRALFVSSKMFITMQNPIITKELLSQSMTYESYKALVERLLRENRATGDFQNNSEKILQYTQMNLARMSRAERRFKLLPELASKLESIDEKMYWLIITEGWCGDAAQTVTALNLMGQANPLINVRYVLRDEHPLLMDAFLSEGSRSIPKLIIIDEDSLEVQGTWGPRPADAQQKTVDYKKGLYPDYDSYATDLHSWYAKDKYRSIQEEMTEVLAQLSTCEAIAMR